MIPSTDRHRLAVAIVFALFKQYFDIAFLMGKPQDLPSGETQMYVAILLNFVTYILALLSFVGVGKAALHASIDIGCSALFIYLALMFTSRLPRFHQALGAICGAGAVLNIAAIPMLYLTLEPVDESGMSIAFLTRFILLVWGLSLVAHVIRHTFSIRMSASVGVAVLYYVFITSLLAMIFPPISTLDEFNADEVISRIESDNRMLPMPALVVVS